MKPEDIQDMIPSIAIAHLFHAYGKLEELIDLGFDEADSDFYMMFYEVLSIAADCVYSDYDDNYDVNKWYFSNKGMVEYYRLCRTYGSAHRLKLKDNPYMQEAERFVESAMDLNCYGYGWYLNTKIGHEWASGLVLRTDCYFNGESELLEALLSIRDWYERGVKRLREKLAEEQKQEKADHREAMAA
ncbi:MAG: hypothetical protein ACI3XG_11860 [Faecousia sp.]